MQFVHRLQPTLDHRWKPFLERHPRSSVFHSLAWLTALQRAYGYTLEAMATSPCASDLQNALVVCRVESWITGRRLVSLPFSDHCEPLVDSEEEFAAILEGLQNELQQEQLRYLEIRPVRALRPARREWNSAETYCLHQLDLGADLRTLFTGCHKDSIQRKIMRAERECLQYEEGRGSRLLETFYRLLVLTRRRHMAPPQPKFWFRCLIDSFGDALKIRVAYKDEQPIAGILTLRYKDTLVYKYGASDARFHRFGGMQFLLWRSIVEAKRAGLRVVDLGRSAWNNEGLIRFKDRWGAERSVLTYWRLGASENCGILGRGADGGWKRRAAKALVSHLPDVVLRSAGGLLYRHIG